MKLGLLVVLAVAVLAPSLSEGRTVSRCELKQKLGEAIVLPRKLQRYKERILALGEVHKCFVGRHRRKQEFYKRWHKTGLNFFNVLQSRPISTLFSSDGVALF